jgi:hypothetical protein
MKIECPACGKMHNCKSNNGLCPKCKLSDDDLEKIVLPEDFADEMENCLLQDDMVDVYKPVGKLTTLGIQAMYERLRRKDPPPLDRLFLMPSQVGEIPTYELKRNCGGTLAFKGIPVTVYYREADMLADFFVECMEQKRRVAYIDGDTVVRNDT